MEIPSTAGLLGADWRLSPLGREDWIDAVVPGDVRLSLLAAGRIPDPFADPAATRWTAHAGWRLRRSLPPCHTSGRRTLVAAGIDYRWDVCFDGVVAHSYEGMFGEQRIPVPARAAELEIRLHAPAALPRAPLGAVDRAASALLPALVGGEHYPPRLATWKLQMSYGWDFAPALPTAGVWDDLDLHTTGESALADAWVDARPAGAGARCLLHVALERPEAGTVALRAVVRGPDGATVATLDRVVAASAGVSAIRLPFTIQRAERWAPWERGGQPLYTATVEATDGGARSDRREVRFGVRALAMAQPSAAGRGPASDAVRLIVDGAPLFIRGANWVPMDSLLRLPAARYRQHIALARDAGLNMLRVWGGGLRERRAFYDACDELGMLVWQEFPLSVAFFDRFPRDAPYLAMAGREAAGIVRSVRRHPSVALYCGGNEFSPGRNAPVIDAIARAVAREDGTRPFRAASPGPGERHNWRVWHGWGTVADYQRERLPLLSEFGLQAAPAAESLAAQGLSDEPGAASERRNAQVGKLERYARTFGWAPGGPGFAAATQRAQAHALQTAIEAQRLRSDSTGFLFWQWNEPWPAVCWSVVDWFGREKQAVAMLRRSARPILPALRFPLAGHEQGGPFDAEAWLVNDTLAPITRGTLVVSSGGVVHARLPASAPANGRRMAGRVAFALAGPAVSVALEVDGRSVAANLYDLAWRDPSRTSRWHAVRDWITWRALH